MMDKQLREIIGKAAYEVLEVELPDIHPKKWDKLSEEKQEINMKAAEAAVSAFFAHMSGKEREV